MRNSEEFNKSLDSYLESKGGYLKRASEDIDQKGRNTVKLGSKQWLPIYGIFQVIYDVSKRRSNIVDDNSRVTKMLGWIAYQSFWATPFIYYLTKKL